MEEIKIFDQYQQAGLTERIGSDDKVYESIQEAIDTVANYLEDNLSAIPSYVGIALDTKNNEEEVILIGVEKHVMGHWKMVRSHFSEMPITLYRAIILQALEKLLEREMECVHIIWFSIIDIFSFLEFTDREEKILNSFIGKIRDLAEGEAIKKWSIIEKDEISVKGQKFNLELSLNAVTINVKSLENVFARASGPRGTGNIELSDANRHYPNSGQHWSWEFAPIAAKGIAKELNEVLKEQGNNLSNIANGIQEELDIYFAKLGKNVKSALQGAIQSTTAVERRSQLLWWKEALYSTSLKGSYRKYSHFENSIALAFDIYYLLPSIFPTSVDYLLREVFYSIHGVDKNTVSLKDFLDEVRNSNNLAFLAQYFEEGTTERKRNALIDFLRKIIYSDIEDIEKEVQACLGIGINSEMTYEDISVWLLHALTVQHLTTKS